MPLLKTLKKKAKKAISPKHIGKRIERSMRENARLRKIARKAALKEKEKLVKRVAITKERIKAKRKIEAFKRPRRFVIEGYGKPAPIKRKAKTKRKKGKRALKKHIAEVHKKVPRDDIDWLMSI